MREAPTDRSSHAYRRMPDQRGGLREQQARRGRIIGSSSKRRCRIVAPIRRIPTSESSGRSIVTASRWRSFTSTSNVGPGEPHRHQRHEALPARDHLGAVVATELLDHFVDARRAHVLEGRGLQEASIHAPACTQPTGTRRSSTRNVSYPSDSSKSPSSTRSTLTSATRPGARVPSTVRSMDHARRVAGGHRDHVGERHAERPDLRHRLRERDHGMVDVEDVEVGGDRRREIALIEQHPCGGEPEVGARVADVEPNAPLHGVAKLERHLAVAVEHPRAPAERVRDDVARSQRRATSRPSGSSA